MLSIILPTYNEAENIVKLIPLIDKELKGVKYEIIVVDDDSPDGTAQKAHALSTKYPVTVILRENERGLASATKCGFNEAKYPLIGVMDSDLQHNPKYLKPMLAQIADGADMVIGSRYLKDSAFDGWPIHRKLISKTGLLLAQPVTGVKDPLGQFYIVKKSILDNIEFRQIGFKLSMEILAKGEFNEVREIPIVFESRKAGDSKLGLSVAKDDLYMVLYLAGWKIKNRLFPKVTSMLNLNRSVK